MVNQAVPMSGQTGPNLLPSRRRFLFHVGAGAAAAATVGLVPAGSALAARLGLPPERSLSFRSLHTGERLTARYVRGGQHDAEGLAAIDHILRDWRTGEVYRMDRGVLDLLYAVRRRLDSDAPIEIISAYRSPKTNAKLAGRSGGVAKRSLHMRGMAIDFRLPERDLAAVHRTALDMKAGGVGLYTRSGFLHVDTGRVRRWGS